MEIYRGLLFLFFLKCPWFLCLFCVAPTIMAFPVLTLAVFTMSNKELKWTECVYDQQRVLPWTDHACGCAAPATLHCLRWAASEEGLSPAHKSCQRQTREESYVNDTDTHRGFAFFSSSDKNTDPIQLNTKINPTDSLPPTLSLHGKQRVSSRGCSPQAWKPVSLRSSLTRYWHLDVDVCWINCPTPDIDTNRPWHY